MFLKILGEGSTKFQESSVKNTRGKHCDKEKQE